jgi:serine protease AprX
MCKAATVRIGVVLALVALLHPRSSAQAQDANAKIGPQLRRAAASSDGRSRVIVRASDAASTGAVRTMIANAGGGLKRHLASINAEAADVPNGLLVALANSSAVNQISLDRVVVSAMERTGATVGATALRQEFGYDGSGIGVAIIDSGVTPAHDDLTGPDGAQRVDAFVDFVNNVETAYDDYGHGTHVAGIIAGNGFDSAGARSGIAPGARLVVLKALDANGGGRISDVIAAIDYIVANKDRLNIRVVNLSIATGIYESYNADPLTLAAKAAVDAGIVVVAAAGNAGRAPHGHAMYGSITAPGNAPWVLTVGASSHMGTVDRGDDTVATFSSRGPTAIDFAAKPDLVAPGVGIESLASPESRMYAADAPYLLSGTVATPYLPYLSLSGTSMSAPAVAATVALMLQANPALTPNAVKAILQYTAQRHVDYDALTQGAGFLNALGAVELARYIASRDTELYPDSSEWSQQFMWGSRVMSGGQITAMANAWDLDVVWGAATAPDGQDLVWGVADVVDGSAWEGIVADAPNIVWGSTCGGLDCQTVWMPGADGTVFTSSDADTVVWGSTDSDTVVWGSSDGDTVVWGSSGDDTVVWGSSCTDTACRPVIWK